MITTISALQLQYSEINTTTTQSTQTTEFEEILAEAQATKEACEEVEVYMLTQIMKQMKASTKWDDELIPTGDYETMFEDMQLEANARNMVEAGGIGLAQMMYENMMSK